MKFGSLTPKMTEMREIERLLGPKLREIFSYFPILALIGARQSGKSTLIRQIFGQEMETFVFDPVTDLANARKDPDFFLQNHPAPVFLDEIQYAPELLPALKRKVDREGRKGMYILSGSQNFSVMKNISESLAGRVYIQELYPMCGRELDERTDSPSFLKEWLDSAGTLEYSNILKLYSEIQKPKDPLLHRVWKGGFPGLLHIPDSFFSGFWNSYVQTYIERDVRLLSDIESLQSFGNFFSLLSSLTANEINYNELGRELGIDRKTAVHWAGLAKAGFQWIEIPAFHRNSIKRISSKKKGYFSDTGLISHFQRIPSPSVLASHPFLGRMTETYIFLEVYKLCTAYNMSPSFSHFRSHSGAEVDLILEYGGQVFPFEIKTKSNPDRKDCRGISKFKGLFPEIRTAPGIILCSIERPEKIQEDVIAVPYWML